MRTSLTTPLTCRGTEVHRSMRHALSFTCQPSFRGRSQQPSLLDVSVGQQRLRDRTDIRKSSGRAPPGACTAATSLAASAPTHVHMQRRVPVRRMAGWDQFAYVLGHWQF